MNLKNTIFAGAFATATMFASDAEAYVMTITNGTTEPISVDVSGVGVVGSSMLQQKIKNIFKPKKKIWSYSKSGNTERYNNAGAVWHSEFRKQSIAKLRGHEELDKALQAAVQMSQALAKAKTAAERETIRKNFQAKIKKIEVVSLDKPLILPGHTMELNFNDIDIGICFDYSNFKVGTASNGYSNRVREVAFVDNKSYGEVMDAVEGMGEDIGKLGEAGAAAGPKGEAVGAAVKGIGGLMGKIVKAAKGTGCRNTSGVVVQDGKGVKFLIRRG